MTHQTSAKKRKELKLEMAKVFGEEIQTLSSDLQDVLLDDIVTAFENRLTVLNRANVSMHCITESTEDVELETIQA
jgi:hypothetical protein